MLIPKGLDSRRWLDGQLIPDRVRVITLREFSGVLWAGGDLWRRDKTEMFIVRTSCTSSAVRVSHLSSRVVSREASERRQTNAGCLTGGLPPDKITVTTTNWRTPRIPNGKPGEYPLTGITLGTLSVRFPKADVFIREMVEFGSTQEIGNMLFIEYSTLGKPDVLKLQRVLAGICDCLKPSAKRSQNEVSFGHNFPPFGAARILEGAR